MSNIIDAPITIAKLNQVLGKSFDRLNQFRGTGFRKNNNTFTVPNTGVIYFSDFLSGQRAPYVTKIATGQNHTLAMMSNGTVRSWGLNNSGQLGVNDGTQRNTPVSVFNMSTAVMIAAGLTHSSVIRSDSTVYCWGDGAYGQFGRNILARSNTPVPMLNISTAVHISCGTFYTGVVLSNGSAFLTGYNRYGQLGVNDTVQRNTPVPALNISTATRIGCGENHTMVVLANGTIWGWGQNNNGQLGVNDTWQRNMPVQVWNISTAVNVACGQYHTLALLSNSTMRAWGANSLGNLGLGNTVIRQVVPATVVNLSNVTAIAASDNNSLAIIADRRIFSWGGSVRGQLGTNITTQPNPVPVQVFNISTAIAVSCDQTFAMALLSDNSVRMWGLNANGQLGLNDTVNRWTPVPVTVT
jgi:alpha-tubulin suppressor-like RCC1 family protein